MEESPTPSPDHTGGDRLDRPGPGDAVSPGSLGEVSAVCRALTESRVRLIVRSRPGRQEETAAGAVVVSVHRLARLAVDRANLVARAEAGAELAAVVGAAAAAGLALVAPTAAGLPAETRVGELVARGGIARRGLSGIEAILAGGETVRAGGAMLKDVAGYDLVAALLGSGGRLAVITAAWFRLQPAAAPLEAHEPAGRVGGAGIDEVVRAAFDPGGILVGG